MLQGVAADCNSAEATRAWFDSRIAHHLLTVYQDVGPWIGAKSRRRQPAKGWPKEATVFNRILRRFDEITASIKIVTA